MKKNFVLLMITLISLVFADQKIILQMKDGTAIEYSEKDIEGITYSKDDPQYL